MAIHILYQDSALIALNKPSGQLVIPGRGDIPGVPLANELEQSLKKKIFVVHRLDRGASGIVLFARSARTHRDLSMKFENREVKKMYQVLVQGQVPGPGRVETALKAFGSGRMGVHPSGKPSVTDYTVRETLPGSTLLDVSPHTGRRHQIRVHLYSIGHPVMGDPLYGKERPVGGAARLMLHAWKIELIRETGEPLMLEAPIPSDFNDELGKCRGTSSAAKPV